MMKGISEPPHQTFGQRQKNRAALQDNLSAAPILELPMMKLYFAPRTRSFSALWLMEETGQPYERVLTDLSKGAQKTPEFLAINPMAKVPALKDGEATLAEAAAICAYVTE